MKKRFMRVTIIFLLVATLVWPPTPVTACSISADAVFTFRSRPDFPMREYVQGNLGIPQPAYPRMYLVVAYRYLSGAPLDSKEQHAILAEWESSDRISPNSTGDDTGNTHDWIGDWIKLRDKTLGKPAPGADHGWWGDPSGISRWMQKGDTIFSYPNCLPDAFRNAVERARQHIRTFGEASQAVRDWTTAQDQVFTNCRAEFGKPNLPVIPAEATTTAPAVLRADRAYQIAAAHFYAGQLDEAREGFDAIAQDALSPWQNIAPYLAARVMLREGTLNGGDLGIDADALAGAETLLRKVIEDPSRSPWHESARGLLAFTELRLHPRERLHQLSAALSKPGAAKIRDDLTDYTYLMDHFERNWAGVREGDDLTDWIAAIQTGGPQEGEHALARWRETSSPAWLVAALMWAKAPNLSLEPMLVAAARVPPESPAFAAARFHRLRLLVESGACSKARAEIDSLLAGPKDKLPLSARNLFLALRMKLAQNVDELLTYAPRSPAGVAYDDGASGSEPWQNSYIATENKGKERMFDADAAQLLNRRLPLPRLARAAQSQALPLPLHRELAVVAWTRSVLLGDREVGRQMAGVVAELAPEMKQEVLAYSSARSSEDALFAGAFAMLRFPGSQIEVQLGIGRWTALGTINGLRDNWWCSPTTRRGYNTDVSERAGRHIPMDWIYPEGNVAPPAFLSEAEKSEADREWQLLSTLPPAPNYFSGLVLDWATKHPDDPRIPEALHLVVRATRYGCTDGDTGKYSKAAFDLLHKRFPKSEWTKQTPYWFK